MPARWALAVQNAVRNVVRDRRRQKRRVSNIDADAVMARPEPDGEVLELFRNFLRQELGELAVELFDRRLDGQSLNQIAGTPSFEAMGLAGVRRLIAQLRQATGRFARGTRGLKFRRETSGHQNIDKEIKMENESSVAGFIEPYPGFDIVDILLQSGVFLNCDFEGGICIRGVVTH